MVCQLGCRAVGIPMVMFDVKFTYQQLLRFQRWVEHLSPPSRTHTLSKFVRNDMPPLDVWMVLHAYLLNPQLAPAVSSKIRF
jgi:hypothetical protein